MSKDCIIDGEVLDANRIDKIINVDNQLSLVVFDTIESISKVWNKYNAKGIFNSSDYLLALENALPEGLKQYYLVLKRDDQPIGLLFMQVKGIDLSTALNIHTHETDFISQLKVKFKKAILTFVKHDLLIVGNVVLTGQFGINFSDELSIKEKLDYLNKATDRFAEYMNAEQGFNIKSTLIKDFRTEADRNVVLPEYTEFAVDPYMFMNMRNSWNSFEDYLADLKSKYRVRYKRALKKFDGLERREMSLGDLKQHETRMFDLYRQISENITFNLFNLSSHYFYSLKEQLKDDMSVYGLFKGDEMVAFYTLIKDRNENILDAHFLGYEMKLNGAHQIYQNMLYFMIGDAIEMQVKEIHLSRTAMEIKSSVGAVGEDLFLLLKYNKKFINKLLNKYLGSFLPDNSWVPRQPFKEES